MMHAGWYLLIRLLLWIVAVLVAVFPTLIAMPTELSASLKQVVLDINAAGLYRDLFFIVIPASTIALSTVIDYLCMYYTLMSGSAMAVCIIALIMNMAALAGGFIGFLTIPHENHVLSDGSFSTYSWLIGLSLGIGFATEGWVSWNHGRLHAETHKNGHETRNAGIGG